MRIEIGGLQRRLKTTTIYVTHDQVEAMTLGDRIVVLADGRIQQVGRPIDLYRAPANRFVAGFIGTPPMNFVGGTLIEKDGQRRFGTTGVRVNLPGDNNALPRREEPLTLGIRPEDLRVQPAGDSSSKTTGSAQSLVGRVVLVERLGGTSHVHFDVEEGAARMMASVTNDWLPDVGDSISVTIPVDQVHLFAADGTAIRLSAGSLPRA
jgi:ABC-type sugar transport system ATPase subunit